MRRANSLSQGWDYSEINEEAQHWNLADFQVICWEGKTNEVKRERWCIVDNDGGLSAADGQLKDERVQPIIGVALIALSTGNYNVAQCLNVHLCTVPLAIMAGMQNER